MDLGGPDTWGESANGLKARLYVVSTGQQPRASAVLVFHLRNTSDKPIRILKLSAQARSWGEHLPLEIRRSGAILKYQGPVLEPPLPPNESAYITLNPRDVDSIEVTFVPEHWKLAAPFEAQAVFVFKQTLQEEKTVGPYDHDKRQWRTVSGLWTGEARSQAATVKIGTVAQTPGAKPARVASAKAAARAAGLKKSGNSYFELRPVSVAGMKRLVLYPSNGESSFFPTIEVAYLSPEQHRAIIDYLAVEGFLDNAASYDMADPQYKGPTIVLRAYSGKGFYDENLGWNPKMLRRLDGLQKLLNGDAGKAMGKFLAQIKAQQEEREPAPSTSSAQATQPAATQRADRAKLPTKGIQDQAERELIDALVRAIKRDLPADWSVAQVRHGEVTPTHRPAGQGWEIRTLRNGYKPADMKRGISVEGRLWIMDSDYIAAAQPDMTPGAAQFSPARELPPWHGRRVFESGETHAAKALQETRTVNDVRKQWAALIARYKSKDERYWDDSIRELDRWTDDRVIPEMIADFRNNNVDAHVRRSTLRIVARMDDRKTIPIMVEAAKDSDVQIRSYAVACLGRKGGPEAFGVIKVALKDANENVRHSAMVAMGALRDNRSLDVLLKLLEDPNDLTRGYAAEGLGELGDQRARPRLAAAMKDKSELVRRFSVVALARLGDPIVLDCLLTALKTDVDGLRGWAAWALGQLGDRRAVEPLIVAMKDQDVNMRSAAVRALGKLNDRRAVEPLLAALKDADSTIRRHAAESLGELGEPRAVEALKPLLSDNVDSVRAAASNALKKLQQAAPRPATQPADEYEPYRQLFSQYKDMILKAAQAGDKAEVAKLTDRFKGTVGQKLRYIRVQRPRSNEPDK